MNFKILLMAFIFPVCTMAQNVQWVCTAPIDGKQSCNGYITDQQGKILIAQIVDSNVIQMSSFESYSSTLGALETDCGSGCSITNFVDLNSGKVSTPYQDVVAVNVQKNVVATANLQGILMQFIFNPTQQIQLNLDFDQAIAIPAYMVRSASFLENGNLNVTYINSSGTKTTKTIPVDYSKFSNTSS